MRVCCGVVVVSVVAFADFDFDLDFVAACVVDLAFEAFEDACGALVEQSEDAFCVDVAADAAVGFGECFAHGVECVADRGRKLAFDRGAEGACWVVAAFEFAEAALERAVGVVGEAICEAFGESFDVGGV